MKPIIGITCNYDPQDVVGMSSGMGVAGQDWNFVSGDYVYAIEQAGGIPILLPRCKEMSILEPVLDRLDGILVTGGHDVDPRSYNQRIMGYCGRIVPERDEMDLSITNYAYQAKKPILAICRGIQILNAAIGGTLYQDLEKDGDFEHHFMGNSPREYPVHKVSLSEGSIIKQIFGQDEIQVNSYHHQAVWEPGSSAVITAYSEDGVPEAIEVSGGNAFVVGVQWHPEMMFTSDQQKTLFRAFINACQS